MIIIFWHQKLMLMGCHMGQLDGSLQDARKNLKIKYWE